MNPAQSKLDQMAEVQMAKYFLQQASFKSSTTAPAQPQQLQAQQVTQPQGQQMAQQADGPAFTKS